MERRGFLKLLGIGTAAPLALYAEPLILMPALGKWVEDKGDFYIVRVPEGKTFANETLGKPTIFLLGAGATVLQCDVRGFVNLLLRPGTTFDGCRFDGSQMRTEDDRPVLTGMGEGGLIRDCTVIGPPGVQWLPSAAWLRGNASNDGGVDYYDSATVQPVSRSHVNACRACSLN